MIVQQETRPLQQVRRVDSNFVLFGSGTTENEPVDLRAMPADPRDRRDPKTTAIRRFPDPKVLKTGL